MRIWFWGAGKYLEKIMDVIVDKEMIAGIIDKSEALQGCEKKGISIFAPENASVNGEDIIIITALFRHEELFLDALQRFKTQPDKVLCFFDEKTNYKFWKAHIDILKWEMVYENILLTRRVEKLEREIGYINNLKYEIQDMVSKGKLSFPCIRSGEEALYKIIVENKCLCRFGDGEFEMIAGRKRPDFQLPDGQLGKRLREVLMGRDDRVLTCIADNYGSLEAYTEKAANDIRAYMTEDIRQEHMDLLDRNMEYYDAYVSRPYILFKNKERAEALFQLWKRVWENRDILIVEGSLTRNGYKNDLFNSAKSVKRLLAPAENAWAYYRNILEYILENIDRKCLIIISLGPTATVLAYDLALAGYQAIDIGHIDNEYEWYLRRADERTDISYKYVHETVNGRSVEEINDADFDNQIIARIGC